MNDAAKWGFALRRSASSETDVGGGDMGTVAVVVAAGDACVTLMLPEIDASRLGSYTSHRAIPADLPVDAAVTPLVRETVVVSPAFAPTWSVLSLNVPSSSGAPLNRVLVAMRSMSAVSWVISLWMAASPPEPRTSPLAACTARVRMRWRIAWVSLRPPSAVCNSEMPSRVLRAAWSSPPTWAFMPSEIARPAASSAARLIRSPEASRSVALSTPA